MKKAVKKKWLEALRSGEYKQGQGVLRRGDTFCCLGVLCELAANEGVIPGASAYTETGRHVYDARDTVLPNRVITWAFTKHELRAQGSYDIKSDPRVGHYNASAWNDHQGKSFSEIADLIEEHL